jgi:hypothetical protein
MGGIWYGRSTLTHALNLVLPLKQDEATRQALAGLANIFESQVQPAIDAALRKSELVHFARVLVIGTDYICVITEYEGDHKEYTEFFRRELAPVFAKIFGLAEGAPSADDPAKFWEYAKEMNRPSLGRAADGALTMEGTPAGWLFSAYDHKDVKQIKKALAASSPS